MSKVNSNAQFGRKLKFRRTITDILRLVFPGSCVACQLELTVNEDQICQVCLNTLTYTDFEKYKEPTLLDQKFWGRIPLEFTYALCYFEENKAIQKLIHELKYKHNKAVGIQLGKMIGERLREKEELKSVDVIIPVPLHHRKEFTRGYNQSEILAQGINSIFHLPIDTNVVTKGKHTQSQTKNNRILRWEKAQEQFIITTTKNITYKHALIVDDVITTGSTLESLIIKLQKDNPDLKVSVISLAFVR